jgi:hypothetical protein
VSALRSNRCSAEMAGMSRQRGAYTMCDMRRDPTGHDHVCSAFLALLPPPATKSSSAPPSSLDRSPFGRPSICCLSGKGHIHTTRNFNLKEDGPGRNPQCTGKKSVVNRTGHVCPGLTQAGWSATASECGITSTEVRNRSAWLAAGWQAAGSWHADTDSTRHDRQ